ncbi:MAG: hypothetical protein ACJAVK_000863 [Akkermansiaceae bacterium]
MIRHGYSAGYKAHCYEREVRKFCFLLQRVSHHLKMRVLGALEHAPSDTLKARYLAVSIMTFQDENGKPHRFTKRTIQTSWYHYREHGVTDPPARADKNTLRKVTPEDLLAAIAKAWGAPRPGIPRTARD